MSDAGALLQERFAARFGGASRVFRAPGRINLIGEHTDYNEGFVMPAAIDRATLVAAGPRTDGRVAVYSETLERGADAAMTTLAPTREWTDYVFGVAAMLQQEGIDFSGANLLIASDVPLGSGLSSSAALTVSTACALLDVAGRSLEPLALAQLCQRAENEFVGARCGIMDQFIATHGRAGHALLLDCRSLTCRAVPVPDEVRLVVCNTMVRHSVAAGEYNTRRRECEHALHALATRLPHVHSLRDVTADDLARHGGVLNPVEMRRVRHVVSENARVLEAADALADGAWPALGPLLWESHRSLRDDYAVSCRELDVAVEVATTAPGGCASRMTGGGFGGCTVNVVTASRVNSFVAFVGEWYERRLGKHPEFYVCNTAGAAGPADG